MLYQAYQAQADIMAPLRGVAGIALQGFGQLRELSPCLADSRPVRHVERRLRVLGASGSPTSARRWASTRSRRAREVAVREEATDVTAVRHAAALRARSPTASRCRRAEGAARRRRCPVTSRRCCAAPSARCSPSTTSTSPTGTTRATSASPTAASASTSYIEHLIHWLELLGPEAHVIAVCQPCVPALVADRGDGRGRQRLRSPARLTLMAGPDRHARRPHRGQRPRHQPAALLVRAQRDRDRARCATPAPAAGCTRASCSSASFVSMNLERHLSAHRELYQHLVDGDEAAADGHEGVLRRVLRGARPHRRVLPGDGRSTCSRSTASPVACSTSRAGRVDPAAIRQHRAAHRRGRARRHLLARPDASRPTTCARASAPMRKRHHLQPGVGHYGVFNGRRWEAQIYPLVHNLILANS